MIEEKTNVAMAIQTAEMTLSRFRGMGYTEGAVNPIEVAKMFGVNVVFTEFKTVGVGAFFNDDTKSIHVNRKLIPSAQSVLIAHELGHYLMHKDWVYSDAYEPSTLFTETDSASIYDREADIFVQNLLLPKSSLEKFMNTSTVFDISKIFVVPISMIGWRMAHMAA